MQHVAVSIIYILIFSAIFHSLGSIARKMGYSYWLALLSLIPGLNIYYFFVLAFRPWPIECQLAELRLTTGESNDIENDVELVMFRATRCEKQGQWDQALLLYTFAAKSTPDPKVKQYALENIENLKQTIFKLDAAYFTSTSKQ